MTPRQLEWADPVALLPTMPSTFRTAGVGSGLWKSTLERWGLLEREDLADLVILTDASVHPSPGTTVVTLRTRGSEAAREGVARYHVRAQGSDTIRLIRREGGSPGVRARLLGTLRRQPSVEISSSHGCEPAAVTAAGGGRVISADFSRDQRRRSSIIVERPDGSLAVLKVGPSSRDADRCAREQAALARLHAAGLGSHVPTPLGHGTTERLGWACESRLAGVPFDQRLRAGTSRQLLDALWDWLTRAAVASRTDARWDDAERRGVVALRGSATSAGRLLDELDQVPAVLSHGDLATGTNILRDGHRFGIIDWETARFDGLPLLDLLPLLCLTLARDRGLVATDDVAGYVVALCRGEAEESRWLLSRVCSHLDALGLGHERAGALAMIVWAHQASMRTVHDELAVAFGEEPVEWEPPAEAVWARWADDDRLGQRWSALRIGIP